MLSRTITTRPRGEREYAISDHLGSTRAVLDSGGNTLTTADYEPFGAPLALSTEERKGWIDREANGESGLRNHGHRQYDPLTGRFVSVDALWETYASIQPYQYSANNSLSLYDNGGDSIRIVGLTVRQSRDLITVTTRTGPGLLLTNLLHNLPNTVLIGSASDPAFSERGSEVSPSEIYTWVGSDGVVKMALGSKVVSWMSDYTSASLQNREASYAILHDLRHTYDYSIDSDANYERRMKTAIQGSPLINEYELRGQAFANLTSIQLNLPFRFDYLGQSFNLHIRSNRTMLEEAYKDVGRILHSVK